VEVRLAPEDEGTRVQVIHGGVGNGGDWAEIEPVLQRAWAFSLENLKSIFNSGADLRFTQRPMLGITISDFNADIAERMGVPVSEGICLDGVVPGMGAGAAGLQDGDVIVGLDGQEVTGWPSLTNALQGRRAGDTVEVDFYRGPERKRVQMTLSGRPLPQIPSTVDALTDAVSARYAQMDSELSDLFDGVSEAQAAHRVAPGAWSAREVLAHLIHSERGWHTWISDLVSGQEAWYDDWGNNLQARIDATLQAFPTTGELLEELHRLNAETVAFVAHLPASFLERKASYWRLAYQLLEAPYHFQTHMEQMREAMEAA
jgi:hypothetical protein